MATPNSAEDIVAAVARLSESLQERNLTNEFDQLRRLPEDIVSLLRAAGVFRMNMPAAWDGPELTSMDQVRVVELLARCDASIAWCSFIWCDSGIYSGYLEDDAARALYPDLDMAQSGWIYPVGTAEQVDGGYLLSGRWMFGSGVNHCDMLAAGCTVTRNGKPVNDEDGRTMWRILLAPPSSFEIEDTWYTTGLRGTGSHHYNVDALFVPAEHAFSFAQPKRDGALWRRPDTLVRKMCGVPLGLARGCIDDAVALLSGKSDRRSGNLYRNKSDVQRAVAKAETKLGAARAYVFSSLEAQWDKLVSGEPLTEQERAAPILSRYHAFQTGREIAQMMSDAVGGESIYANGPLERRLRDSIAMCQHIVAQPKSIDPVGSMMLGNDVSDELFL